MAVITIAALISAPFSFAADEDIGIFETIRASSVSFDETTAAVDAAFAESGLVLHATHDVRVPGEQHRARVYVLTSPTYLDVAKAEPARTVSAQVLRIAVYTKGDEQKTFINMANPVAHAMVFYANSSAYDALVAAARNVAAEIRELVASVPGEAMAEQQEPKRGEKHYNAFKGDGPARMMAKFRTFQKSQLLIAEDTAANFEAVVDRVTAALSARAVADADDTEGWEQLTVIRISDDAAYIGITNPYIEDRMIRINSRFRKDGKSELRRCAASRDSGSQGRRANTGPALWANVAHAVVFLGFRLPGFHRERGRARCNCQLDRGYDRRRIEKKRHNMSGMTSLLQGSGASIPVSFYTSGNQVFPYE
jgi:hypothetical protein